MKGIPLARAYYESVGRPLLERRFPALLSRLAVGLVGHGSECYGFDDELSTDHDYGPSFCLWVTQDDYARFGEELKNAYDKMPRDFLGVAPRALQDGGKGRVGVLSIPDFYRSLLGRADAPSNAMDWLFLPESRLACATNGAVFQDPLGEFSTIRKQLLAFYPEGVRIKKISARLFEMGQSGQYNYARCMQRGELVAAHRALSLFMDSAISCTYLLNKRYKPFYKWMHRGLRQLPRLSEIASLIERLASNDLSLAAWEGSRARPLCALNTADCNIIAIEQICRLLKEELQKERLTDSDSAFLPEHQKELAARIEDRQLRELPLMEGS